MPNTTLHMPGERRRAVALASLATLIIYFIGEILAAIPNSSFGHRFAELLGQPILIQAALLAPIWLGAWLVALAQRQLIAHKEGAYAALQAISHVRGMRGPGLTLSAITFVLLVLGIVFNLLTPSLTITGALITVYLFALGLPNAPNARYAYHPAPSTHPGSAAIYEEPQRRMLPAASRQSYPPYIDADR